MDESNTKDKTYWHDAHHEALRQELYDYLHVLEFHKEHQLSQEALSMDSLIIKNPKNVHIKKNIGQIFRQHNIVEYKSEKDNFDIHDYNKVLGYAYIYSAFNKIPVSEITISISLTIFPRDLAKHLERVRGHILKVSSGIYNIIGAEIPIQILESKNLSADENLFLHSLRSNVSKIGMKRNLDVMDERKLLNTKNVYLDRLIKANATSYKEALGMVTEDLKDILLEAIDEYGWWADREQQAAQQAAQQATQKILEMAQKMLRRGLSLHAVAEDTDLPLETVQQLASQL